MTRTARREFPKPVYMQIVRRAMLPTGEIACEGCGLVLGKKPYHVDHTIPDALFLDKARTLTAADGKLLGVKCCHAPKTKTDVAVIAQAKRREAKHNGVKRAKSKLAAPPKQREPSRHQSLAPRKLFEVQP